jgi:hypothetical protein
VPANSLLEWGTTTSYGSSASSGSLNTSHSLQASGIANNTQYYYRITSVNSCGQAGQTTTTFTR